MLVVLERHGPRTALRTAELLALLAADGYDVAVAHGLVQARAIARRRPPHALLLGHLGGPAVSLEMLAEVPTINGRVRPPSAIVLGCVREEGELVRALDAGADDALVRDSSYTELSARLRARLRELAAAHAHATRLEVGALAIDRGARTVMLGGEPVALRNLEFELLAHLARAPHRVFGKHELLAAVWGYRSTARTRTVDSHALRLRRELRRHHTDPWVVTVWGVGYRLI
ncbi:MAG TPA: response regulator transcription factor [Solirubrobacteraceae bacterium]|nr:response regulator transcription factor [Solirubrobacteraceae bacterium]